MIHMIYGSTVKHKTCVDSPVSEVRVRYRDTFIPYIGTGI